MAPSIEVVKDWVKNKKRIQDRIARIKKRLKKYEKQKHHFELRLFTVEKYLKDRSNNLKK
jgi:predicted  nucleic acid-binding Zn-ribbon protein